MTSDKNIPTNTISKIKALRKQEVSAEELTEGIFNGNKTQLAKAITLLESTHPSHYEKANTVIEKCLAKPNASIRIGITGVPGVGKSSFIETFGTYLTSLGKKVAVLAVDPTSSLSKGSILGDKTRMQELSKDPNAFIRPSPSGTSLGGVARKTRESIILCEAAGYDVILVETVGVGQSEIAVHSMVDFFLLLKLSGAGDELQGIKRGIMEMADAIAINKADGSNLEKAELAATEFSRALHLYPPKANGWIPKVLKCSATENTGIKEIWDVVENFVQQNKENGFFDKNRKTQNKNWFLQTVDEHIKQFFHQKESFKNAQIALLKDIDDNKISPFYAAKLLLDQITKEL
ncbi:methylmalonyl Co-A mutase-associated GTPase MeaB [Flagellimonas pelagia]|uniref:Methylmalonyl Co-A mutase-associated GTPase MeaB n=1 Tax=Flagellimonas pelagia TaxID=2306998 RepID=A0A3A1NIV8_9FLAO|nr:methylmalonyl Co-A mutase-associated GTPase MeaB [Allomuricauda maritima]RIV45314.1 methylmalonyl Co-A mutase-associated GTPase MeaB [Allomuricauda maritima]TXJ96790.1 methylmalonyl Co-A mutase-associated GTPase MeaB [Allomuricauda maritima]